MSIAQRASGTARQLFVLGEGQLQIGRGVRTAFALIVPVIVGDLLAQPLLSWAALGGWLGSLADKGGSYRTRAATMGAFAILGSACVFAGTDAAGSAPLAVASMLVAGILGGLGRVYGDEGSTVGLFIAVLYAVAVGSPSAVPHAALLRAEMFAAGAAWAMVLSLLLWPLHPFRPARRAVAESYRVLAELALALASVSDVLGDQSAGAARDRARALHASVRSALEHARVVLADVRRRKQGRSPRGEQLLVLTEGAEQLFGTLVAIEAELEAAHEGGSTCGRRRIRQDLRRPRGHVRHSSRTRSTTRSTSGLVRASSRRQSATSPCAPIGRTCICARRRRCCRESRATCSILVDTASHIDARALAVIPTTAEQRAAMPGAARDPLAWLRPLREALTLRSLPARHALRMGVAAAVAVWISFALDITRGYWATITTLIVLQPYAGATIRKTLQRVGGSVLGGIIAAALAVVARTKLEIAAVMVPFTVGAVAVLPLNYGVFVLLLTPVFVLLAEPHPGDWGVAGLRVVNTLLGGGIALAASQLLWPAREIETYAMQLAGLLRDLRALLAAVTTRGDATVAAWRQNAHEARRRFGVAVTNAEATMQRLIAEDAPNPHRVEAAMTILTYGRRMASTMSAIAESRTAGELAPPEIAVTELASQLDALADALAGAATRVARAPALSDAKAGLSIPGESAAASELGAGSVQIARLDRLRAQLSVMQRAVARYLTD